MNECLSDNEMSILYAGSGSPHDMTQWRHHIRVCDKCAMQFVKLHMRSDSPCEGDESESELEASHSQLFSGLEPNNRIGDFVIEKRLGSGGMGIVYKAFQQSLNRPVALKVLPSSVTSDKTAVKRFHREARAAAKLHHTNIIAIYAEGEENSICYYAMEMLEGRSLDQVIKELRQLRDTGMDHSTFAKEALTILSRGSKQFPATQDDSHADRSTVGSGYYDFIARLMVEAAKALAYAHDHQVIHRDVKPSNLMLTNDGYLVLMDFGLARLLDEQRMTLTGGFVGTPYYMSPELITGPLDQIDYRIDVYSLGATLYELLTLRPPFYGTRQEQVTHQILHQEPVKPRHVNSNIPVDLETICCKAMEKSPSRRYASAADMADDLQRFLDRYVIKAKKAGPWTRMIKFASRHKLPTALISVVLVVVLVAGSMTWKYKRLERVQQQMIPEIVDLVGRDEFFDALILARKVEKITPGDPTLQDLWSRMSKQFTIRTTPTRAMLLISKREERDNWKPLGHSPLNRIRIPFGTHRMRIERSGFRTQEFAFSNPYPRTYQPLQTIESEEVHYELRPEGSLPPEMVWIPSSDMNIYPLYNLNLKVPDVPAYLIDKYETTNQEYLEFIEAGGYQNTRYWEHPFVMKGKVLDWHQAMAYFTDQTGQSGPATWANGTYPEGRGHYPVGGISWYEASAYARFRDKHLPTIFHWKHAAISDPYNTSIVYLSNFDNQLAPVGHYPGIGHFGLCDAAGNVREWCYNAIKNEQNHYLIQGGAWEDNTYMFTNKMVLEAWNRDRGNGVRCVRYFEREKVPEVVFSSIENKTRDLDNFIPISNDVFQSYVDTLYHYDSTELEAVVQSLDEETPYCRTEKISFNAAYLGERVSAYLNIPKGFSPPYQIVLWFPGGSSRRTPWRYDRIHREEVACILRSGRALVIPVMKGTFDRRLERNYFYELTKIQARNLYVQRSQDMRRTIDYLETREDIDTKKLAYVGLSWGGQVGSLMIALEPRFRTGILLWGGLVHDGWHPSSDPANFAPYVTIPMLMLNGREDSIFPYEKAQKPLFNLLGTPDDHKKHLVFPGGHSISWKYRKQYLQAITDWLDRYLGPVNSDRAIDRGNISE